MTRPEYIRDLLIKRGVSPDSLSIRELTYNEVSRMSSLEQEWHERENGTNFTAALDRSPAERASRKAINDHNTAATLLNRSKSNRLTPEELKTFEKHLDLIFQFYPWLTNSDETASAVSSAIAETNCNFLRFDSFERLVQQLISLGAVRINPCACGGREWEDKYGDSLYGPADMCRVHSRNLQRLTTRKRPQSERESIDSLSADEFYRHPEYGRPLREERNKHADAALRDRIQQDADQAVEWFLASHRDYKRTNENRDAILNYLESRNLLMTRDTLAQAYRDLTAQDKLELTAEHCQEYGASSFVDLGDLPGKQRTELPAMHQSVEIVTSKVKMYTAARIHAMDSVTYAENMKNPEFVQAVEESRTKRNCDWHDPASRILLSRGTAASRHQRR